MLNSVELGNAVRITATFKGLTGQVMDPSTVVCRVRDSAGAVATPSVTRSSTGIYYADITVLLPGVWTYRWEGTGTLTAAHEATLFVTPSAFHS